MNITEIEPHPPDSPDTIVKVMIAGNIIEIKHSGVKHGAPIQRVDKDHFVDLRTGEVLEVRHKTNRGEDKASVAQSLKRLRNLINANLTNPNNALWVTLTYAENMTDPKRLYSDFGYFMKKLRKYLAKKGKPRPEYIAAAEPQGRGAWHLHCLFIFPGKAPFVANSEMSRLWGQGFTKTTGLSGIDNIGLYLTAYLGDMELDEAIAAGDATGRIAEVETTDEHGNRRKKAIVKGARMRLYPAGFNLYRRSMGIRTPKTFETTEAHAQQLVGTAPLTYEKTLGLIDENGELVNFFNYRQYNRAKK